VPDFPKGEVLTEGISAANKTIEPPAPIELQARIEAFLASGAGDEGSRALLGETLALLGARALPTGSDVSGRNAVDDQLRIREGRFRRLLENASDGIALVTPAGEVLDLSAAAERIMGTTLAKLRADPSLTEVHIEDRPRVFRAFMRSVSTGGRVGPVRYRCRRTTGEWVWLETVCTNLLSDPEVRALVLNFRDITDQVAKEETLREYRAFLEKAQQVASIGSWKADVYSMEETLVWSRETYRIFGLDPDAGEIDGHKFFSMVHPEDRELVRDASRLAIAHGKPHNIDHRIVLPDGRIRWVNEQAEILRDSANHPILMVGVVQDITERKAAQAKLEQSERRFRVASQCASDCIFELDLITGEIEFFGNIDEMLGYEPGGTPRTLDGWIAINHADDRERLFACVQEHAESRTPFKVEYRTYDKAGRLHYWEGQAQTIHDAAGKAVQRVGAISDVTGKKAAEDAIRESESRFRRLVESNIIGAVFSALDGSIWDANDAFLKMVGYTRSELEAGEIKWTHMTPDEYSELDKTAIEQLMARGSCDVYEKEFFRKDGSRVPILLAVCVLDSEKGTAVSIVLDITERKAATEALQRMNVDLELKVEARTSELRIQSNRRAALADLELAINTPAALQGVLRQIVSTTSKLLPASAGCSVVLWDGETEKYTYCASSKGPYKEPLKAILRKRGGITRRIIDTRKPFCVEDVTVGPDAASRNPIVDARGVRAYAGVPMLLGDSIIGVMYAMESEPRVFLPEDIEFLTAMAQRAALAVSKVRLSDELRTANEVLETEIARGEITRMELANAKVIADAARIEADRANRAKSEFLSRMSHELRTPLNAVLGFTQILEMQPLGEDDMKCVNHIAMAGAHLLNLINEVLDISRIESGKMSVSPEAIRLKDVLRQSLELVRPQLERRSIEIHWDTTTCDGTWVSADPSRLRQVFLNLLSNAIKYNREGGSISLRCETLGAESVRLYFADTGIGIPPSKIERIFTPFDRLGQESSGIEGSGLGLALSKRLVDVMRGNISVESLPGQGTTVMLDLRLAPPPSGFTETTSEMRRSEHPELLGKRARVLYVEDNQANIELMQRILTSFENIELLTATEGATGLEVALRELPDVVILDLHLPDMSGAGVLNRLKANPSSCDTPVIIVSADASPGQIDDLLAAGANDYITKPINVQHFLNVLKGHLEGIRTEVR
jgi:PAS domain S-box-containing protein